MSRALACTLIAMALASSLVGLSVEPASATVSFPQDPCLNINSNHELVSADYCTGNLVIPASVTTIKSHAFVYFKGAISFEANSQLTSIEANAFEASIDLKSIVFPANLSSLAQSAYPFAAAKVLYFEGSPAGMNNLAITSLNIGAVVQPRGASPAQIGGNSVRREYPFQIDCNNIDAGKDFLNLTYVALELHNCKDPRNPSAANPPATMGYILNRDLNESVALESADGQHHGLVRLRRLGDGFQHLVVIANSNGSAFSISAFGDEFEAPAGTSVTCQSLSGSPLPLGVSVNSDCKISTASTSALASSSTAFTIDAAFDHGPSNSFDVAQSSASPTADQNSTGTVSVQLSLRKSAELTLAQLFQMKLATAQFSGTTRDWQDAIAAYRALPSVQVPVGPADVAILAADAVEQFESGFGTEANASSAVVQFGNSAAPWSTFLTSLKDRIAIRSVSNAVSNLGNGSDRPQDLRQRILALPASADRDSLASQFSARVNSLFQTTSSDSGNLRTLTFQNPYAAQTFTVPAGVSQLTVQIDGAEGSQGGDDTGGRAERAGYKGRLAGSLEVSGGQVLTIGVGEAGGVASSDCLDGKYSVAYDSLVAKGGINPLGGYAGGNGGSPGVNGCSGYGGAGGAASVIKVGSVGNPDQIATLVAGGSAGSTGASDAYAGRIGLATSTPRIDRTSTSGQSGLALWYYTFRDFSAYPSDGGADGGGGGGAQGGAIGGYDLNALCGVEDYCPLASSPGANSTGGVSGLGASYVRYTFDALQNSNGKVTIAYVVPPVSSPAPTDGSGQGSSQGPGPTATPTATPTPTPSAIQLSAPTQVKVKTGWKFADVTWVNSDSTTPLYEVSGPGGQTCLSQNLTCKFTGLKPGQLFWATVRAKYPAGWSAQSERSANAFVPLSVNLWQARVKQGKLQPNPINRSQLLAINNMLELDSGGFVLNVRVARNASRQSAQAISAFLTGQIASIRTQLGRFGNLKKVRFVTQIAPPNSKALNPSVILILHRP